MFKEISGSYAQLSAEERDTLATLIQARIDLAEKTAVLDRMRVKVLRNYTPEGETELAEYARTVLDPLRRSVTTQQSEMAMSAIDVKSLKALLPMILLGVSQGINLPMLLATMNVEPDHVEVMVKAAKEYFDKTD